MRDFDEAAFDRAIATPVAQHCWQEEPEYYPRYRTRYEAIVRHFALRAPTRRLDVLDIGGGQLAYLAAALWQDNGSVADIDDSQFAGLRAVGLDSFQWNVARDDPPTDRRFDTISLSEGDRAPPRAGHVVFRRLRALLRSAGFLLCSTSNLYRLRNIAYLILGRRLFDHFDEPSARSCAR